MREVDVRHEDLLDVGDRAQAGRSALEARLAGMAEALGAHRLSVVRQNVYRDEETDGTGDLGWLWLRATPRRFPDEAHDLMVRYSTADGDWLISLPDGRVRHIPVGDDVPNAAAIADLLLWSDSGGATTEPPVLRDLPDWVTLVLSGAATSVIVPFVQAIAGKSADDAYAGLRARLARRRKSEVASSLASSDAEAADESSTRVPHGAPDGSGFVSMHDPDADLQIVMPDPIPLAAVRQLIALDRSELRNRILVWDDSRQEWVRCRRS